MSTGLGLVPDEDLYVRALAYENATWGETVFHMPDWDGRDLSFARRRNDSLRDFGKNTVAVTVQMIHAAGPNFFERS